MSSQVPNGGCGGKTMGKDSQGARKPNFTTGKNKIL